MISYGYYTIFGSVADLFVRIIKLIGRPDRQHRLLNRLFRGTVRQELQLHRIHAPYDSYLVVGAAHLILGGCNSDFQISQIISDTYNLFDHPHAQIPYEIIWFEARHVQPSSCSAKT